MKLADCGPLDETFSFALKDGTRHFHWNVTKIAEALDAGRIQALEYTYLDIADADYVHICLHNGIEEDHLLNITPERMKVPVLFVEFPAEPGDEHPTHALIDGNHRIVQTYRNGGRRIGAAIIDHTVLAPFLVEEFQQMASAEQVRDWLQGQQKAKP